MLIRNGSERGFADHGWLKTWHSFSFAGYHDPAWMGYRTLRVLNDDIVAPGGGFPMHPHRDMEIISYVVEGSIEHRDNMGNSSVLQRGEIQVMTAGTGIMHSEFNPDDSMPLRLLQIWVRPDHRGLNPRYDQQKYDGLKTGSWQLLAAPDSSPGDALVRINTDALLYRAVTDPGSPLEFETRTGRHYWLQVVNGRAQLNGIEVSTGDGVAFNGEEALQLESAGTAEFLLFDLP